MNKSDKDEDHKHLEDRELESIEQPDVARRAAMLKMGGYAASVAPAMLVLMSGRASAAPGAPCDSPAWELGLSKAGHSGC